MKTVFTTLRAGLAAALESGDITPDEAALADLWLDLSNSTNETLEP